MKFILLFTLVASLLSLTKQQETSSNEPWTAHWMSELPKEIVEKVPLVQLALPGSHDSLSYNFDAHCNLGVAVNFALTQNWDMLQQLNGGIRYFDLRIYVDETGKYRINHGIVKGGPEVLPAMRVVRQFLRGHRGEFVILHLQHFNYVGDARTKILADKLTAIFNGISISRCQNRKRFGNLTLAELRAKRQQVMLISDSTYITGACMIWGNGTLENPYFPTRNVSTIDQAMTAVLEARVVDVRMQPPYSLFVHQTVMAVDTDYILHNLGGNLRDITLPATQHFAQVWLPNKVRPKCRFAGALNIVMCDWVDSFDFPTQVAQMNWHFWNNCLLNETSYTLYD